MENRRTFLRKIVGGAVSGVVLGSAVGKVFAQESPESWQQKRAIFLEQIKKIKETEKKLSQLYGEEFIKRLNVSGHLEKLVDDSEKDLKLKSQLLKTSNIGDVPFAPPYKETPTLIEDLKANSFGEDKKISWQDLDKVFQTLPRGWVYGKVKSISHSMRARDAEGKELNHPEYLFSFPEAVHFPSDHAIEFSPTDKKGIYQTLRILYHEIVHANDPENCDQLSGNQKLQLFLKLAQRSIAIDRLDTERMAVLDLQFDTFRYENGDFENRKRDYSKITPQQRLTIAKEYFAELGGEALASGGVKNSQDWSIFESVIRATDPGYDWKKNSEQRTNLTMSLLSKPPARQNLQ